MPEDPIELTEAIDDELPSRSVPWLPILGMLASLGWIGAMLWLSRDSLATLTPPALVNFVAGLCVPPALIAILLVKTVASADPSIYSLTIEIMGSAQLN